MTSSLALPQLFADVHRLVRENDDYAKAVKVTDKILSLEPENRKAIHCKCVCLIRVSEFQSALDLIDRLDSLGQKELAYEKAYCLYRLNLVEEAIDLLRSLKSSEQRVKELMAQSLYRLERYEESYAVYVDLIKNSSDECEDERETNLSAAIASLSLSGGSIEGKSEIGDQIYELCYNKSCIAIGQGSYEEAKGLLEKAENLCVKTLKEEEQTEEEIEMELGIIHAQMGYVHQMLREDQAALHQYNQVLKSKPDDQALLAVVSNNIVALNKGQNVFDSKKKMKAALSEDAKLNSMQKKAILTNNCVFLMMTGQIETCKSQISDLKNMYTDSGAELIEAGLLVRNKQYKEAISVLQSVKQKNIDVNLTLCQLLILQGKINDATSLLRNLGPDSKRLGILSTIVSLYLSSSDKESAVEVLKDAITWYQKNSLSSEDYLVVLYRETSKLLIQMNRAKEAAILLEEQRKLTPNNPKVIAQLIAAYQQFDRQKAAETIRCLPPIDSIINSVDVNALEEINWSLGAKYVKKTAKADALGLKTEEKKKKKKRKRKRILPKNYDPNVEPDPERWLPKWQRSNFKRKNKRKEGVNVGRGTQGAIGEAPEVKASPKAGHSVPQSPPGPRQQAWQKKKKSRR